MTLSGGRRRGGGRNRGSELVPKLILPPGDCVEKDLTLFPCCAWSVCPYPCEIECVRAPSLEPRLIVADLPLLIDIDLALSKPWIRDLYGGILPSDPATPCIELVLDPNSMDPPAARSLEGDGM